MNKLIEKSYKHVFDDETEAKSMLAKYDDEQLTEGYTLKDRSIKHKVKKDRKTGEIVDETWTLTVTKSYEE